MAQQKRIRNESRFNIGDVRSRKRRLQRRRNVRHIERRVYRRNRDRPDALAINAVVDNAPRDTKANRGEREPSDRCCPIENADSLLLLRRAFQNRRFDVRSQDENRILIERQLAIPRPSIPL